MNAISKELELDARSYYDNASKALIYNKTRDPKASTRRTTVQREFLKLKEGENLKFTEKNQDDVEGRFQLNFRQVTL